MIENLKMALLLAVFCSFVALVVYQASRNPYDELHRIQKSQSDCRDFRLEFDKIQPKPKELSDKLQVKIAECKALGVWQE
jgi:hypothetical protein